MEHSPHAGTGVVSLQVAGPVPHERTHTIADPDTRFTQSMGQLMRAVTAFFVGLAPNAILRCSDNLFVGRHFGAAVQNRMHQQGRMLHRHCRILPIVISESCDSNPSKDQF